MKLSRIICLLLLTIFVVVQTVSADRRRLNRFSELVVTGSITLDNDQSYRIESPGGTPYNAVRINTLGDMSFDSPDDYSFLRQGSRVLGWVDDGTGIFFSDTAATLGNAAFPWGSLTMAGSSKILSSAGATGDIFIDTRSTGGDDILFDATDDTIFLNNAVETMRFNAGTSSIEISPAGTDVATFGSNGLNIRSSGANADIINELGNPTLYVFDNASVADDIAHLQGHNSANGAKYNFFKSRATDGTANTVVQVGDNIGTLNFYGADGTDFEPAAQIAANVSATPGANDMPGEISLSVTADGASTLTEVATFDSGGLNLPQGGDYFTSPANTSLTTTGAACDGSGANIITRFVRLTGSAYADLPDVDGACFHIFSASSGATLCPASGGNINGASSFSLGANQFYTCCGTSSNMYCGS